ncbi:hypothetical protein TNCV_786081 [Trichonephila clavipes]|nr:hypothetical protein TNCV_786081 [Trichonephila clavipes]
MAVFRAVIEVVAGVTLSYTLTIITLNSDAEFFSTKSMMGGGELILRSILTGRIVRAVRVFVGDGPEFSRLLK